MSGWTAGRAGADSEDWPNQDRVRRAKQSSYIGKQLNDYLSPLRRYLLKQVGRPWNKVYSEICKAPGGRTLKDHLRLHVDDFVAIGTRDHRPLYVDRRSGILKRNA